MNQRTPSAVALRLLHPRYEDWVADLEAIVGEEAQRAFVKATLRHKANLHVFGRYFFPHMISGDVEPAHLELVEFLAGPDTGACIFPRGHGKSTWEKIDTIHDCVYGLEPVIVYVSDSIESAGFHFTSIKGELEGNELLRRVYGSVVPDVGRPGVKWNDKHFETTTGVNVVARGPGKGRGVNIRNRRPTKIIIDDAETDEMVNSAARRRKFWHWLTFVIIPSLDKQRGRLKFIGTTIHPEAAVLRFWKERGGIFRRAVETVDGVERTIWSAWTMADHVRIRDGYVGEDGVFQEGIGYRAWMQEYQNEAINDETAIFKREWVDLFTYEKLPEGWQQWFDVVMAVDPAAGLSQMADFYGYCVMGRDRRTGKRYVMDAGRFKGSIEKALAYMVDVYLKWTPRVVAVESVMNMTAFGQLMHAHVLKDFNRIPVKIVDPEGKDKVARAQRVEPFVEQGVILFSPAHTLFYSELIAFPNAEHDDMVDAFLYANFLLATTGARMSGKKSPLLTSGIRKKKF